MTLFTQLLVALAQLVLAPPLDVAPVAIPAGTFTRGAVDDPDAEADEKPARSIFVSAFSIDRTEVTRAAYASCVVSGRCAPTPALSLVDLSSRLPMTAVSWREAAAYCAAVGARLPTEAEWERAARGGVDHRRFPWGDEPDCARGNFGNFEGEGRCPQHPGRPVEVGRFPGGASPEGVLDLAGNVWEWTADYYDAGAYRGGARVDPRGPVHGVARGPEELGSLPRRSVRGGACCSVLASPRLTNRVAFPEDYHDADLGFRCAR